MSLIALDQRLFLWLNETLSGLVATWFFGAVTWLGNGFVLAVLILPSMARWDRAGLRRHVAPLVAAVAATGAAVNLAKIFFDRARPALWATAEGIVVHVPFGLPSDKSFPSGHAQTSFGAAVYLSLLYPRVAPVFLALAFLVGLSRIALGVHFPSDVVVGALAGAAGSWLAHRWATKRSVANHPGLGREGGTPPVQGPPEAG